MKPRGNVFFAKQNKRECHELMAVFDLLFIVLSFSFSVQKHYSKSTIFVHRFQIFSVIMFDLNTSKQHCDLIYVPFVLLSNIQQVADMRSKVQRSRGTRAPLATDQIRPCNKWIPAYQDKNQHVGYGKEMTCHQLWPVCFPLLSSQVSQ